MKHTFTRQKVRQIILEELQADLLIESAANQILEEGVLDAVKNLKSKFFPNKSDEEVQDELDEIEKNPETLNTMPRTKRIGILFLAGMLGGFLTQGGFDYEALSSASAADARRIASSVDAASQKSRDVQNFMQMASAEAESGSASTPEQVDAAIKRIVRDYMQSIEAAPISPGRGIFIGGDVRKGPLKGFAYVPASSIPDDEILPFIGVSKKDYETLLRATFLSGEGGDQRLEDLVMGQGKKGSSGFWAYDNNRLFQGFQEDSSYAMLPLEWSVAYELLNKRKSKGRL